MKISVRLVFLGACTCIAALLYLFYFMEADAYIGGRVTSSAQELSPSPSRMVEILMWTAIFGQKNISLSEDNCVYNNQCALSFDQNRLPHADAVVIHGFDFDARNMPDERNRKPLSVNVFVTQESFNNAKEFHNLLKIPENYFHWFMNYMTEAHVTYPYGSFWVSPEEARRQGFSPENLPYSEQEILANKSRSIIWAVSNCKTVIRREKAIYALKKYIDVDIIGKCGDPIGTNICPKEKEAVCKLYDQYYFIFIAENSICKDYISEKYWNRYHLPVIPIVMRRKIYEPLIPPNSFISMDDFHGPKALADYLHFLMNNPAAYMKYFEWRKLGWAVAPWNTKGYIKGFCSLCEKLLKKPVDKPLPKLKSVERWFEEHAKCEGDEFVMHWTAI